MSLAFWIFLWKLCLVMAVVAFAVMAVIVTIGGALDVGRLFERLRGEVLASSESSDEADSLDGAP